MIEPTQTATADEPSPDLVSTLFGFRGRIGRGRYWAGIAVVTGFLLLTIVFLATAMNPTGGGGGVVLAFPALLTALWVHAAVTIKRLRDMGWSAWLYLGLVVAFAGASYAGTEAAEATGGLSLLLVALVLAVPGVVQTRSAQTGSAAV
jgi:uncharacterized membrane protein YhaH (DUF805 family)